MFFRWMVALAAVVWLGVGAAALAGGFDRGSPTVPRPTGVRRGASPGRGRQRLCVTQAWSSIPDNTLNGVAAASRSEVWAVGETAGGQALIERWNGRAWGKVASPNPGGRYCSVLSAVSVAGRADAWAVGYYSNGHMLKTLIAHWNGRAWRQVPSPSPGGPHDDSTLTSVAAAGSSSAWAVGSAEHVTGSNPRDPHVNTKTLIERWNGRAWKQVASPSPGGSPGYSTLGGVAASGPSGAWAVGVYRHISNQRRTHPRTLIVRWNGRAWRQVAAPSPGCCSALNAVATTPSGDAWAVGNKGHDVDQILVERWNGRAWSQVASPIPPGSHGSDFYAVSASGSSDAWAVGDYVVANKANVDPALNTLIEHWNGRAWKQVASPNPGGSACCHGEQNILHAVSAASPSTVWATGSFSAGSPFGKPLIERWTDHGWTATTGDR